MGEEGEPGARRLPRMDPPDLVVSAQPRLDLVQDRGLAARLGPHERDRSDLLRWRLGGPSAQADEDLLHRLFEPLAGVVGDLGDQESLADRIPDGQAFEQVHGTREPVCDLVAAPSGELTARIRTSDRTVHQEIERSLHVHDPVRHGNQTSEAVQIGVSIRSIAVHEELVRREEDPFVDEDGPAVGRAASQCVHADLPDDVQAIVVLRERGRRVSPESVEREADELPVATIRSDERGERDHVRGEIDHAGIGHPPQARMVAHQIDGQDRATRGVAPATDLHREARLPRPAASDELDDHR